MEQNIRFGLILGRLAILKKKIVVDYEQLLRVVFSCFQGQKSDSKFFQKYYKVRLSYPVADFVYTSESNESCEKHSTQR